MKRTKKDAIYNNTQDTNAEKIWKEIKEVNLTMFSLPNQKVEKYYKPMFVEPNKLFLVAKTNASSSLAALEECLKNKYTVVQNDKFVVIEDKVS